VLTRRGVDDPHVVFTVIMEDDDYWFFPEKYATSSVFFKDAMSVLRHAEKWCKKNCLDNTYGFQFK